MQKDLLAELHLPELDLKSLQNIVIQNSARLASLIKENNEHLIKNKPVSLDFIKVIEPMVSDFKASSYPKENIEVLKRKFIIKKSPISSNDGLKNAGFGLHSPTAKAFTAPSNVMQEYNTDDKNKCEERVQESQTSVSSAEIPTSDPTALNIPSETEPQNDAQNATQKDDIGLHPSENITEVQLSVSNPSAVPSPVNTNVSPLKTKSSHPENVSEILKDVTGQPQSESDLDKGPEPAVCVISEVIGNATAAFSGPENSEENSKETPEVQLITPKKTNDITKIKGWRRKQFFVEKPTTIEFYSIAKGSFALKKEFNLNENESHKLKSEEPGNVKNAFVCDSLDDFLDREAELKIGYEIPHLYAEFGIKLTRGEIVSTPNLSEKDIKEVETRYCVPVKLPSEIIELDDKKEEVVKGIKRSIEDDTKHFKTLKLDDNKKQPVKTAQELENILKIEENLKEPKNSSVEVESKDSNVKILHRSEKDLSKIKLVSKLIALVVYPGPSAPLHPIVQYHLDKIRSYRTKVDENWANFAASAVLVNDQQYKRRILPAYCCAKIVSDTVVNNKNKNNEISAQKEVEGVSVISKLENHAQTKNPEKKQIKLKKCSVRLEKLNLRHTRAPWCMDHNCYNCIKCGLNRSKYKYLGVRKTLKKSRNKNLETVIVSPRASFDKEVANLLAKKVRLLKVNGDTLKSIDCLKILSVNTVEFIKLKFVKENFLSGYLKIWYVKPEVPGERFRAFLNFSDTPPFPNAVNLKFTMFSLNNLPKVITEIVSAENTFDSNEYAILHCDGKIWEIHGSLNIAFGKCNKNVEQIFTSTELPELKSLQKLAYDILRVKAVKWWVLDLTQKFQLMEVKSGNLSVIVTRGNFIETVKMNLFGFLPLRKTSDGRVLGALIMQRLLPFVLIGPYYLLETSDLVLRSESSSVPFKYYGEENVTMNYPLKFFINSVINNMKKCDKKLEGLWLYDKMCLDSTSYIEVVTTDLFVPLTNKYSSIYIEHGYSLTSLTNPSPSGVIPGIVKRKNGNEEFRKITVYLCFNIYDLGFVEGELQFDNSVIISHPLDKRKKMKSHKIGDWFLRIIKRRIEFIPKNLVVKWFITKHKEDLRHRRPFNKFYLGGAHILTRNGVFYLLEMSDSKMEKLGIDRTEIVKAISQSEVITEVKELKSLSNLLLHDPSKSLSMHEVLTKAVNEIEKLRNMHKSLKNEKTKAEKEKLYLGTSLIKKLNQCRIPFYLKMKILEKLEPFFMNEKGDLNPSYVLILRTCGIGRKYLKRIERLNSWLQTMDDKADKLKSAKPQLILTPVKTITQDNISPSSKDESTDIVCLKNSEKQSGLHVQTEKVNSGSEQFSSFNGRYPKILRRSSSVKKPQQEDDGKKKPTDIKSDVENSSNSSTPKNEKFLKLTSPELPDNIKIRWKNWVANKLEVA